MRFVFCIKKDVPSPLVAFPRYDVPHADVVVRGGRGELCPGPTPGQGADRVDVGSEDFGDATGEEVPHHNPPVITANSKQGPEPVEAAGNGHRDTVQGAIELLWVVLSK